MKQWVIEREETEENIRWKINPFFAVVIGACILGVGVWDNANFGLWLIVSFAVIACLLVTTVDILKKPKPKCFGLWYPKCRTCKFLEECTKKYQDDLEAEEEE